MCVITITLVFQECLHADAHTPGFFLPHTQVRGHRTAVIAASQSGKGFGPKRTGKIKRGSQNISTL